MASDPIPEPDEPATIYVGQDSAGHWLVQDSGHRLEGRFVSREAAIGFARGECRMHHACLCMATAPLVPSVSFAPLTDGERVAA